MDELGLFPGRILTKGLAIRSARVMGQIIPSVPCVMTHEFPYMNIVLLGALVKAMGLDEIDWDAEIEANVKAKFIDLNKKAFHAGYSL